MPLGKLSKRQIYEAYSVLSDLSKLLTPVSQKKKKIKGAASSSDHLDDTTVLSASTQFYTLIPHDFGMRQPPLLDNLRIVRNKSEMLESLLEIELAYKMLHTDGDREVGKEENPIDSHYRQLHNEILVSLGIFKSQIDLAAELSSLLHT